MRRRTALVGQARRPATPPPVCGSAARPVAPFARKHPLVSKFVSFAHGDEARYGLVVEGGVVDLSARHRAQWPTLQHVVAGGAFRTLAEKGAALAPDMPLDGIRYELPSLAPEKIICVGVNFPDRNAEYKDGKEHLFGFFVGQTMKAMQGKGNPKLVNERLRAKLDG